MSFGAFFNAGGRCDVLVANILAEILPALAPTLAGLVEDGGAVALSGVRADEAPGVLAAFDAAFDLRDGWCERPGPGRLVRPRGDSKMRLTTRRRG